MDYTCNVKIVDMMMGSGKTSAAINYINQSKKGERFIFITPYLEEVERIKNSCPRKHFLEPRTIKGRKLNGIKELIMKKANIVSTHSLFQRFDLETIELCKSANYTLILDEVANVIHRFEMSSSDLELMIESKLINIDPKTKFLNWTGPKTYKGKFKEEKNLCELHSLVQYGDTEVMWLLPVEAFNAFQNIFILTYMFESQIQKYYYDFYELPYSYLFVSGDSLETYHFTEDISEINDIVTDYKSLIHILDHRKMNSIGDNRFALSKNWYDKADLTQLKKNLYNYFKNIMDVPYSARLWTTFKTYKTSVSGKGYTKAFIPLNTRSTNQYSSCTTLAYPINRYINTGIKMFFQSRDISVDEDGYALSEMLQFIWRSAIRNGKEIWIYIPSSRMRRILQEWMLPETDDERKKREAAERKERINRLIKHPEVKK